jgi:hypothetical protein
MLRAALRVSGQKAYNSQGYSIMQITRRVFVFDRFTPRGIVHQALSLQVHYCTGL